MSDRLQFCVGGLTVALSRAGDRYCHEVMIATGGENRSLLTSLEGSPDVAWPPSPPFQELHTQQHGHAIEVALLVGRAGRSHWSASIEVNRQQETITFDVACRCSGAPDWLGSSYRCLLGQIAAVDDQDRALTLPLGFRLWVLDGEPHLSESGDGQVFTIVPRWTESSTPQTVRWKYRLGRA